MSAVHQPLKLKDLGVCNCEYSSRKSKIFFLNRGDDVHQPLKLKDLSVCKREYSSRKSKVLFFHQKKILLEKCVTDFSTEIETGGTNSDFLYKCVEFLEEYSRFGFILPRKT